MKISAAARQYDKVPIGHVEEYWDARPCNIRHSQKEVGSREYFNEVESRKYFVEPHIPEFAEFEKWKGKKVLDVGCGIGTDTINFARAGANVTAIDYSSKSLEVAKKRAEVFGLDINFYKADAEKISDIVPIEEYDLVYSFGVIHHTPHPDKVISEIKKYMGKDSRFKIMVYNRYSWKVFWIMLEYGKGAFWKLSELIAKYSEAQTGCPVTYSYTKNSIKKLLDGFTVLDLKVDHIFAYSVPEYKRYEYRKVWYFRYLPKQFFRWLERKLGWHLCVTASLGEI